MKGRLSQICSGDSFCEARKKSWEFKGDSDSKKTQTALLKRREEQAWLVGAKKGEGGLQRKRLVGTDVERATSLEKGGGRRLSHYRKLLLLPGRRRRRRHVSLGSTVKLSH